MTKKETGAPAAQKVAASAAQALETTQGEPPLFKDDFLPGPPYGYYYRTQPVKAVRIDGPFRVRTPHGDVECDDGWLAFDAGGAPYPIAADEFENLYEARDADASSRLNPVKLSDADIERLEAQEFAWKVRNVADDFARAILRNALVERFLYGNPLENNPVAGFSTRGELLAHRCDELAEDYVRAAEELRAKRCPAAPEIASASDDADADANSAA